MVSVTVTTLIQLLAALSIPAIVGFVAMTQMNSQAKFQWKQGRIALVLCLVPLVLILALTGILTTYMTLACVFGLYATVILARPQQG